MDDCNLVEIGSIGSKYTWFNKRKSYPIFEKLDRVWVSPSWLLAKPISQVNNLPRLSSDHNPLFFSISNKENLRRIKGFKFEPIWFSKPTFKDLFAGKWVGVNSELHVKLSHLVGEAKIVGFGLFWGHFQIQKKHFLQESREPGWH